MEFLYGDGKQCRSIEAKIQKVKRSSKTLK